MLQKWRGRPTQKSSAMCFFGIVCGAYSLLPVVKDPADVDESDTVAGQ